MNDQNLSSLQNWNAFWDYHLGAWDGRWTRYKPSGELSETFLSNRSFKSDPEKKTIDQFNQYFYHHGEHEEKRWRYSFEDHCKKDGFMHPASDYMRGLAFFAMDLLHGLFFRPKKNNIFQWSFFLPTRMFAAALACFMGSMVNFKEQLAFVSDVRIMMIHRGRIQVSLFQLGKSATSGMESLKLLILI